MTDHQDTWKKAQIETGHFGNKSEEVREIIREQQLREQETPEEIAAIREALVEGEKSSFSGRSVDEIWEEAKTRHESKHACYRLTGAADKDLQEIALYGIEQFGEHHADQYREWFNARFKDIAADPLRYQAVDHIRDGYRRSVCGSHLICYRVDPEEVVIVRILGSLVTRSALNDEMNMNSETRKDEMADTERKLIKERWQRFEETGETVSHETVLAWQASLDR